VMHCTVVLSHKWFLLWFTYRRTPKFFHWFAGGFSKTIPFGYRGKQNLPCSQIVELYDDGSCLSIAAAILLTPTSWNLFIICIIKSFSLLVSIVSWLYISYLSMGVDYMAISPNQ